jgi:hypothetical protein
MSKGEATRVAQIAPARQRELLELVGRILYGGARREVESIAEVLSYNARGRELTAGEVAEYEFVVQQTRIALDRAVDEPTGALERGRIAAREALNGSHTEHGCQPR